MNVRTPQRMTYVDHHAVARGWAAVTWKCHSALQAWAPGVTWSVTWCYLVLPWVLPGVIPGVTWALPGVTWVFISESFFYGPKISAFLKLKLLGKDQFPPRDVTWAHACSRYLFTWPTPWPTLMAVANSKHLGSWRQSFSDLEPDH